LDMVQDGDEHTHIHTHTYKRTHAYTNTAMAREGGRYGKEGITPQTRTCMLEHALLLLSPELLFLRSVSISSMKITVGASLRAKLKERGRRIPGWCRKR
jgi:hypothetical protein